MHDSREAKLAATILSASLSLSAIGCALLIGQESREFAFVLAILILCLLLPVASRVVLQRRPSISTTLAGWLLTIAAFNFLLVVPELALRVVGFRGEAGIQFGYPRPEEFIRFDPDERLFWKLRPSRQNVNSFGFPGHEVVIPKPHDRFRVLFLGDSCTQQGYPDLVELLVNDGHEAWARRFESITLAVSGYSSHQGRVLAEMYGERLEPDMAVVYFGWNDHWQAYQAIDSQRVAPGAPPPWAKGLALLQRFRLVQGLGSLTVSLRGSNKPLGEVRVPKEQYRENLLAIRHIFEKRGVPVVFISAPTSHYRLGVPDYLVDQNFVSDKQSSVTMHRSYNEIVREVSGASGSHLLDLERDFDAQQDLDTIFMRDGIHFTPAGLALVATRVSERLKEIVAAHHSLN